MPTGLKPVKRRLATGEVRTYWYHRATGKRLEADPTTAAGFLEVAGLESLAKAQEAASAALKGTYAALWDEYRESPQWRALKPRTRSDYQAVRDWLGGAANTPLIRIDLPMVNRLRNKAAIAKGRRFGNYVLQVMRLTLEWGKDEGLIRVNPAMGAKQTPKPTSEAKVNRAWRLSELEAFAAGAPPQLIVPFMLGLFAGMRQGDALKITWSAYDGELLRWTASKNAEACEVPVTGVFKLVLDEAKVRRGRAVQIAVTRAKTPWTQSGFRASFFKRLRDLRTAKAVAPGCTFHGLRHTIVALARNEGASDFSAAAAIGDRSTKMAEIYGRDADRFGAQSLILEGIQKRVGNIDWKMADVKGGKRVAVSGRHKGEKPL